VPLSDKVAAYARTRDPVMGSNVCGNQANAGNRRRKHRRRFIPEIAIQAGAEVRPALIAL
jgi:hypothetical protein